MALAIAVGLGDTAGLAAQIVQGAVAGTMARVVIGTLQWLVPRTRFLGGALVGRRERRRLADGSRSWGRRRVEPHQ
jgi:hypothetical protein